MFGLRYKIQSVDEVSYLNITFDKTVFETKHIHILD